MSAHSLAQYQAEFMFLTHEPTPPPMFRPTAFYTPGPAPIHTQRDAPEYTPALALVPLPISPFVHVPYSVAALAFTASPLPAQQAQAPASVPPGSYKQSF